MLLAFSGQALAGEHRLRWREDWPRFRPEEYALTLSFAAMPPLFALAVSKPPSGWQEDLPLDATFHRIFKPKNDGTRHAATLASDVLQNTLILYPLLIDVGLVTLLMDRNLDVGLQIGLTAVEAFVIQGLLVAGTKRFVGRARPPVDPCPGTEDDYSCRSNASRRSFLSGHSAAGFTTAGLMCVYHTKLDLYGGGLPDALACAGALALATADGLLRITADAHFASDVFASGLVGLVAGYAVPYLLHFRREPPADAPVRGMLHLAGAGGPAQAGGELAPTYGMYGGARQWWWWDEEATVGLELSGDGVMVGTQRGYFFREARFNLNLWAYGVSLGPAAVFQSEDGPRRPGLENAAEALESSALAAGGTLGFGILGQETSLLLSGSWLPLGDGRADLIDGTLEVAFYRYVNVGLMVRRSVQPVEDETRGIFLLFAGGRLPW